MTASEGFAAQNIEQPDTRILDALERTAAEIGSRAHIEAAETDDAKSFPAKTLAELKEKGFLTAPLSSDFGGCGLGTKVGRNTAMLRVLKHFGRGNLVIGRVYEGHLNALLLLKLFALPEQYARFAADAADGKLFGVWNTEAADGVRILPKNEADFRLEGAKTFATGSGFVTRPFVMGRSPESGWQMSIVPLEKFPANTDESWWNPLGMRATRSYKYYFSGIEITRREIIGKPDDYYQQPWFSGGAIRFAAVQLGGAEAIFDHTRCYLRELGRIGDPFQQTRLGEMAILIENGNLWLDAAARKFDDYQSAPNEENSRRLLAYVNAARTAIEEICLQNIKLCQKCVGARGLNKPFHLERIIRDLTIYLRQPAPDAALASLGEYVGKDERNAYQIWEAR